jgi:chromate transporter
LEAKEFDDTIAATNLLPGPASTQLAIFCAWRLRGITGAVIGGVCFIAPGLVLILLLADLFLGRHPPDWVLGAAAGGGAAVPAVALHAAWRLTPASWGRIGRGQSEHIRWLTYGLLGAVAANVIGPYLVLVLLACGLTEVEIRRRANPGPAFSVIPAAVLHAASVGGIGALQ